MLFRFSRMLGIDARTHLHLDRDPSVERAIESAGLLLEWVELDRASLMSIRLP